MSAQVHQLLRRPVALRATRELHPNFELPALQTAVIPAVGLAGPGPRVSSTGAAPAHQFSLLLNGGVHHGRCVAMVVPVVSCGEVSAVSASFDGLTMSGAEVAPFDRLRVSGSFGEGEGR